MKKSKILFFILIFLIGFLFFWWNNGISAVDPKNKTEKIFIVAKGAGIKEIANNLKRENLIKNTVIFFIIVKKEGLDQKIQAGDFRLSPSQNALQIAESLTHGTLDIWVTVPEGQRADQIADTLSNKMPTYKKDWRSILENNEGYLFPDTYLFPREADINQIVSIFRNNFDKKYSALNTSNTKYTKNQIVTIASLIEREAKHPQDRPLVASVIENRLSINMALQLDATIQYVIGSIKCSKVEDKIPCDWWPKNITVDDLKIKSFYNTYLNPGLPPTPIANPGLESLKATVNPAKTNYLYYISDKNGVNHYAETLEQHNANIQKYGL